MMKVIKKSYSLLIILAVIGCSEPFSFSATNSSIDVIDAKVSTRVGRSYIRVYNFKNNNEQSFIEDLNVKIISYSGSVYNFNYVPSRHSYLPNESNFAGQVGRKYKMEIIDSDGVIIQSQYDSIPEPISLAMSFKDTTIIEVSSHNVSVERNAIAAIAELVPVVNDISFAKIDFVHTYENPIGTVINDYPERFTLYQTESDGLKVRLPIGLMFSQDFSQAKTEMFLETMSYSSFKYWEDVKKLIINDGFILDTNPFPLKGNIVCENCENEVVGIFRAVSESYSGQIWFR